MNDHDHTTPHQTLPDCPVSSATPERSVAGDSGEVAAPPPPLASSTDRSASVPQAANARQPRARSLLSKRRIRLLLAAAVMSPVIGLSVGLASSPSASAAQPASASHSAGSPGSAGGGSNARSGPAAGGSSGTVDSVSKSSFTMTTSAGQKVTIDESSSTKYKKGTSSVSASTIKKGERVLVLGTVSSTTIKAVQVTVQATGSGGSAVSTAATVIPFQKGAPTTSKQVGQIPASYSQGSGTIVSGTTANKATEAALAAYPGGVVDRVVQLSNGEYEVHYIGVNWPHHIFVNQDFKVVGAN
jgi:Domain of unknown function (DUF5666)